MRGAQVTLRRHAHLQRGFTLVELVLVIVLLGTLSFFAVSRLAARGDSDAHGYAEQLTSALRFTQKAAVAQRRNIYFNLDTGNGRLWACLDAIAGCAQPLLTPAGGALDYLPPTGVAVASSGATQIVFDAQGRPSIGSALDLQVSAGSASYTVRIEPDSGYVWRP